MIVKKTVLLITILIVTIQFFKAQEKTFDLTINITDLSSNRGNILLGVYNSKASFLKKPFKGNTLKIENNTATVNIKNLPMGEYAISYVHDENNNKKLDTNIIGIPSEDYGCSNNARGFMGPPKYDDAKFMLSENMTISINN